MILTQSTPWNDWTRVTRGNTLQDGGLVNCEGEVFRAHQDHGFFVNRWLGAFRKREVKLITERKCWRTWISREECLCRPETVSCAPALCLTPALLWATQQYTPPSSGRTPVICSTPVGNRVYLHSDRHRQAHSERETCICCNNTGHIPSNVIVWKCVFTVLPVIRGIHGPPVSFPADDRLRQTMDLALKPSNTSQLCTHRTWLHMKICHCWRQKRQREIALTLVHKQNH